MLLGWNGNVVWETDLDYLGVYGENEADVLESIQVATGCSAANSGFITN